MKHNKKRNIQIKRSLTDYGCFGFQFGEYLEKDITTHTIKIAEKHPLLTSAFIQISITIVMFLIVRGGLI